eukprot:762538-Hanusia_phi.AAC.8
MGKVIYSFNQKQPRTFGHSTYIASNFVVSTLLLPFRSPSPPSPYRRHSPLAGSYPICYKAGDDVCCLAKFCHMEQRIPPAPLSVSSLPTQFLHALPPSAFTTPPPGREEVGTSFEKEREVSRPGKDGTGTTIRLQG